MPSPFAAPTRPLALATTFLLLAACGGAPKPAEEPPLPPVATSAPPAVSVATDAPPPKTALVQDVAVDREGFLAPSNGILPEGYADRLLKAGSPPQVSLVESGAAPRAVLRYAYKKGDKAHLGLTTDMTMSMAMHVSADKGGTLPPPRKTPQIVLGFTLAITAVDADGTAQVEAVYDAAKASGGTKAENDAVEKELTGMAGSKIAYRVTSSGRVSDVTVKLDPALQGPAREAMENAATGTSDLATPLPEEPIGVGAIWTVDSRVKSGGLDLFRRTRTTLQAVKGSKITVNQQVAALAASPVATLPKLPATATAVITDFSSRGAGTTSQGLTRVGELDGKSHVDVDTSIRVIVGAETMDVRTALTMDIQVKPIK